MASLKTFFVADLNPQGELRQIAEYDYGSLEMIEGAGEIIGRCSSHIWRTPDELETVLSDFGEPLLRWRATASSAGVATIRRASGELVSLSLLAAGKDPEADKTTFAVLQQHLVRELRQTPFEPAFDLLQIEKRPLLATFTFGGEQSNASESTLQGASEQGSGKSAQRLIEAIGDRCFAAAYFRYLGLA